MLEQWIATGPDPVTGVTFHEPGNTAWMVAGATVLTVRLADGAVTARGDDHTDLVAAVPLGDDLTVALVERSGEVLWAGATNPARAAATAAVMLPAAAVAACAGPGATELLVLGADGALRAVEPEAGTFRELVTGLAGAVAVTLAPAAGAAAVLGPETVTVVPLNGDGVTTLAAPAGGVSFVTAPGAVAGYLVAAPDGTVTELHADGTPGAAAAIAGPVSGLARWGSALLAASGTDLAVAEWGLDDGELPADAGLGPLYLSGYRRVRADPAAAGLRPGDVAWTVREGPEAGAVAAGVEPPSGDGTETVMLLAGRRPGEYHLDGHRVADGALLTTRRFRVTASWPDPDVGPPVVLTGDTPPARLLSWGGSGALGTYLRPAKREVKLLVMLVSLADRRWTADEANAARAEWRTRLLGPSAGIIPAPSVRRYYEEVSGYRPGQRGTTVSLLGDEVFGPVDLDQGWGSVFRTRGGNDDGWWCTDHAGWDVMAGAASALLSGRGDGLPLLDQADAVVFVVKTATMAATTAGTTTVPARYAWGQANYGRVSVRFGLFTGERDLPLTVLPSLAPAAGGMGDPTEVLVHETGHNLGMADFYDSRDEFPAEIDARHPHDLDLMATTGGVPRLSLANLVGLGWVQRNWVRSFDFSVVALGDELVLDSTAAVAQRGDLGPRPGHDAGIEIRIGNGWSYLFEYRKTRPGQVADQNLAAAWTGVTNRLVAGYDLRTSGGGVARPPVIALAKDLDGVGPVLLTPGHDYRDSDTDDTAMYDFVVTLDGTEDPVPDAARVTVSYTGARRAQLRIDPAPGAGDWKSPDIRLRNPVSGSSFVVKGVTNTIDVTVHNDGLIAATNVHLDVNWLPFTVSPGTWTALTSPSPFTVPPRSSLVVGVPWPVPLHPMVPATPPAKPVEANHFCVRANVVRFTDALHPENEEVVVGDNWAQSNFEDASLDHGSPSTRVVTALGVANPLGASRLYTVEASQSTPWYRVYVGHRWLRLAPGEERAVELAYESLAGDAERGEEFEREVEQITATDHHVALAGYLVPEGTRCAFPREVGGANLVLRAGRRCWFEDLRREGERLSGRLLAQSQDVVFTPTFGDVNLAVWLQRDPDRVLTATAAVRPDGTFALLVPGDVVRAIDRGEDRAFFVVARPADNVFALALTSAAPLE